MPVLYLSFMLMALSSSSELYNRENAYCKCFVTNEHVIPANFFWVTGVRFLSWKRLDFQRRTNHIWRRLKISDDVENISKDVLNISWSWSQDVFCQTLCHHQYFFLENWRVRGSVPSFTWIFLFLHWLKFLYFLKVC